MVGGGLVAAVIAHLFGAVLAGGNGVVALDGQVVVAADVVAPVLANGHPLVVAYRFRAVMPDVDDFVGLDLFFAVMADEGGLVVVDDIVLVLLGVDEDLFLPGLVLEAQVVEALALVGLALEGHPRLAGVTRRADAGWR